MEPLLTLDRGCTEIQRWWKRTGRLWVYRVIGVAEMNGETVYIYSAYPRVDRLSSHHMPHHLISFNNEVHTISVPSCKLTHSFRDFINPHRQVLVLCLRTLILPSSSHNLCVFRNHSGCRERCGGVLPVATLFSNCTVPPQMEPKHGFWFRKLSMEWRESSLLLDTGKFGENQVMTDLYPANWAQCRRR
jgi:hypothetical protein